MTKQTSIILTLVVLALVASAGFWYVSRSMPQVATAEPVPVATPKPAEPVTLTYTDPEYPFAFDYPSFVSYKGKVSPVEVISEVRSIDSETYKYLVVGDRDSNGLVYGPEFTVQTVQGNFKNWAAKHYPECSYINKKITGGYQVVFSDRETNREIDTPCFARGSTHLYSPEKNFLVSGGAGQSVELITEVGCSKDDQNYKEIGWCTKEIDVVSSLRLMK